MLLWEIAFEKIPYKNWDNQKIIDHITRGNRENIDFGTNNQQDTQKDLTKKYLCIIQNGNIIIII